MSTGLCIVLQYQCTMLCQQEPVIETKCLFSRQVLQKLSILIQVLQEITPCSEEVPLRHGEAETILVRSVCSFDHNWYKWKEVAIGAGSSLENLQGGGELRYY